MQEKLEKWEIEGVELRRDPNQPRRDRKLPEMENNIELDRLRQDVSRLEQELEFTKRFNKAIQDLKDMHCAEWKRAAEEAQKQLESALLQVAMQNRADDTAKKAQEDVAKVQPEFMNHLNEQVNKNTNALQNMLDKHGEEQPVVQARRDAQIMVEELNLKKIRPLAPLIASTCNSMVVSALPNTGVDAAAFCLITPPIAPGIDKSEMTVASVKFTL